MQFNFNLVTKSQISDTDTQGNLRGQRGSEIDEKNHSVSGSVTD